MKRLTIFVVLVALIFTVEAKKNTFSASVGSTMPAWSEGYLDIHTISTGRGECILLVMPDGTSLVVDAGEFYRQGKKYTNIEQRPNAQVRPTKVFADYIRHFMPNKDIIDYFNVSHFHMDHMGAIEPEYKRDAEGGYVLTGVTALYHLLPYREIIDRAYPDYEELLGSAASTNSANNYRKFIEHNKDKNGLKISRFELGAVNQFAMRYNASAYPTFRIENICSNGYVWENGKAVNVYANKTPRENAASCGFVVRYGKFDFLTAGDIGEGNDLEYRVAEAVGRVEAVKAHHHLSPHSMCEKSMEVLLPRVMSVTSFYNREIQPDQKKFDFITQNGCKIFCTSVGEEMLEAYPTAYQMCDATSGHIVFRVEPEGKRYWVYVLDDRSSDYRITKVVGPFKSK